MLQLLVLKFTRFYLAISWSLDLIYKIFTQLLLGDLNRVRGNCVVCFHGGPAGNVSWQQPLQDLKGPVFLFPITLPLQREGSEKLLVEATSCCVFQLGLKLSTCSSKNRLYQDFPSSCSDLGCELRGKGSCCQWDGTHTATGRWLLM